MVRAVFFDLVGTLIGPARPIGDQYAEWARRHGASEAASDRMGDAFRRAMRVAPPMSFRQLGRIDEIAAAERRWWADLVRDVVAQCGLASTLGGVGFDAFFDDLYDHFTTADAWTAYPDAAPELARLRR